MSKPNQEDTDDPAPSYEEYVFPNQTISIETKQKAPLQTQIAATRSRRIQSVLAAYIDPLLVDQGVDGISKRVLVLIPSDSLSNHPNLTARDLAGLPESTANVALVRLYGPENRAAFWQQEAVVRQLKSDLKDRLAASGHKVEANPLELQSTNPQSPSNLQRGASSSPGPGRSSWLRRNLGSTQQSDPISARDWNLEWRTENEKNLATRPLELDEIRVSAKVKDVSFNTESELGLLLTETLKAIWLEIEVGT